jgi:ribosomal protein S18 acetylase RimI-like enzyme
LRVTEFEVARDIGLDPAQEAALDAQILRDIAPYYGELERGFAATHLPRVGASLASIGFSTIAKHAWVITDGDRVVGKAVGTVKRSGALKIGPIMVLPEYRNRGHGDAFLRVIIQRSRLARQACVFATLPTNNGPAQRLFGRAGFRRAGTLLDHYRPGSDEDVMVYPLSDAADSHDSISTSSNVDSLRGHSAAERLRRYVAKEFFPVDEAWLTWLAETAGSSLGAFDRKPHDLVEDDHGGVALVFHKRGGTAKVVPVLDRRGALAPSLLRACERAALQRQRRKISMFLPAGVAGPLDYQLEIEAVGYSIYRPIAVWSHHLT